MHIFGIDWVGVNAENERKLLLSLAFVATVLISNKVLRALLRLMLPARLATAFGLISAGLAFARQQVVTSIAGYFVILRGSTFTAGDRISMGGVRGDVLGLGFAGLDDAGIGIASATYDIVGFPALDFRRARPTAAPVQAQ